MINHAALQYSNLQLNEVGEMSRADRCDVYCFSEEKVIRVRSELGDIDMGASVTMCKALADENRIKIIFALDREPELCVCDLANIIGASVANTSHHLRTLNHLGLITFRKEGKMAFYKIAEPELKRFVDCFLLP